MNPNLFAIQMSPSLEVKWLFCLLAAHVFWCALLYAALTIARAPKIWGIGRREDGSNPLELWEPRISANLSNQFEWPVLFYVIVCWSAIHDAATIFTCIFGLLFLLGRILHSSVQIFTAHVRWRGVVFTLNFLAVLAMWAEQAWVLFS